MNTTYFSNMIAGNLFHIAGSAAFPAKYYIGISSTMPNKDGTGATEPSTSGTGYARVEISNLTGPTDGEITNSEQIVFPRSKTDWFPPATPAIAYTIWDGNSADAHLLSAGELQKSRIVESNVDFILDVNHLSIKVI